MRGEDRRQSGIFSDVSAEQRVPKDYPLRTIRVMVACEGLPVQEQTVSDLWKNSLSASSAADPALSTYRAPLYFQRSVSNHPVSQEIRDGCFLMNSAASRRAVSSLSLLSCSEVAAGGTRITVSLQ